MAVVREFSQVFGGLVSNPWIGDPKHVPPPHTARKRCWRAKGGGGHAGRRTMKLEQMAWPAVGALSRDVPVVIPIAAVEQHGHHLPVFTDSLLLGEIARRTEAVLGEKALFLPLQWLGNSDHHLDFPGTVSAAPRVYLDLLTGLAENFVRHGFRRFVFLNGHGGNDVPARQVVFELRQRHRERDDLLFLAATYWSLGAKPAEEIPGMVQREMGHACEWETSMIMRLNPALVGSHQDAAPVEPGTAFAPAARGWITRERSTTGHIGHPAAATAEKGERLFQRFTDDVVKLLLEVCRWDGQSWHA
jgi:creatinine amidohydrolase